MIRYLCAKCGKTRVWCQCDELSGFKISSVRKSAVESDSKVEALLIRKAEGIGRIAEILEKNSNVKAEPENPEASIGSQAVGSIQKG